MQKEKYAHCPLKKYFSDDHERLRKVESDKDKERERDEKINKKEIIMSKCMP